MSDGDVLLDVEDVHLTLGTTLILEGVTMQVKDRVRPGVVTGPRNVTLTRPRVSPSRVGS